MHGCGRLQAASRRGPTGEDWGSYPYLIHQQQYTYNTQYDSAWVLMTCLRQATRPPSELPDVSRNGGVLRTAVFEPYPERWPLFSGSRSLLEAW